MMAQIITITFSPCIDKSTSVPSLDPEKKLRCAVPVLQPGGGGINVARAIHQLGGEAIAIYPSGGYTGKFFDYLMEKEKIPSIIIERNQETRENIVVFDESNNKQYRFGFPDEGLEEKEWKACLEAVEKLNGLEFIVASGSLPHGVPLDIYGQLAKIAKKKKAKLVIDTSGDALKHAVREGVYLIKPNLGELSSLIGKERIEENEIESIARDLLEKEHAEIVVISMGKEGAMMVTKDETFKAIAPKIKSQSTVGAGDSMVAGIVYSLSLGWPLEKAVKYGVACGTAATMNPGTELCNKKDADHLFAMIR